MNSKTRILIVAGGVAVLLLLAGVAGVVTHSSEPVKTEESADIVDQLAQIYAAVESGVIELDPPSKASANVLAADAIPEKAAPSFGPKHVAIRGATRVTIAGTGASVVAYEGDLGHLDVISIRASLQMVPGLSPVPYNGRRFYGASRPSPTGDVHVICVGQGSRLTCVVGPAAGPKLAELAAMMPQ